MHGIQPLTSIDFDSKVLQAPGPVVLDFYQASCPPCRALEPVLDRVAQSYGDRVTVYRVDIDDDPGLAERFRIDSLPTVLILRRGQEIERLDGLMTEQQVRDAFERASHV